MLFRSEWKLDVPTIGNVYRVAQGIVRYFNGLGRPFSSEGWNSDRHWLHRAWTLQEIKTENATINAGIHRGSPEGIRTSTSNIMNIRGMMGKQTMTLRRAIQPVLKLAADVDTPNGCSLYALVREMSHRKASNRTDKVAGLVYLLRLTQLPTYDREATDNKVWARCFHMLPLARKIELLFDYPYRSEQQHWFPTWSELMTWPEIDASCEYSPAMQLPIKGHRHLEVQDLADIVESEEGTVYDSNADRDRDLDYIYSTAEGSLFLSNIWALSHCNVTRSSAGAQPDGMDYDVSVNSSSKEKVYGFYGPYVPQKPIEITRQCEFTIATTDLGNSNNWVVCKVVKKLKARCYSTSTPGKSDSVEIEIEVLRKVGVLRTDFCGEMLPGVGARGGGSALRRINALFV